MKKGHPFFEVFSSAVKENYRFPILEIFVFLYAFGTFVLAGLTTFYVQANELFAFGMVVSLSGAPLLVFLILLLVNIAYGFGNDIEKGVIQTLLSYPLKRRSVLSAKLLSALGIAVLVFLGLQLFAFYVLAPEVVTRHLGTIILSYLAVLSPSFLIAGIVLLLSLTIRRGGLALVFGIIFYFAFQTVTQLVMVFLAFSAGSDTAFRVISVIIPYLVLGRYYSSAGSSPSGTAFWVPSFSEALLYIGAAYGIVAFVFLLAYVYFDRRLGI